MCAMAEEYTGNDILQDGYVFSWRMHRLAGYGRSPLESKKPCYRFFVSACDSVYVCEFFCILIR